MPRALILGAGLAGLSTSYHLGHANCVLLEQASRAFGHIHSELREGFTWDEGPHVSFTRCEYVRRLFADGVNGDFEQFKVRVGNYFRGHWIDHPAQVSLHQVPEPLRSQCLNSFLQSRAAAESAAFPPADYQEWLERSFGRVFAENFPAIYTRKYWTRPARELATDWVGERMHSPSVEDAIAGAKGPLGRDPHYITVVRYPSKGGYQSFARELHAGANIRFGAAVTGIDLQTRKVRIADGSILPYARLINTLPLPTFIKLCGSAPACVAEAAQALDCSQLLLVNVTVRHPAQRPETWFYVYDDDKLATRVNFTEHLAPGNAPSGFTGIQTEVYASRSHPLPGSVEQLTAQVQLELAEMGLLDPAAVSGVHTVNVPWANVIFTHDTRPALETIWSWLEQFGLAREANDTHPLTDWDRSTTRPGPTGSLAFAGRYGQWKYFWTDDCVLRGRHIAQTINL